MTDVKSTVRSNLNTNEFLRYLLETDLSPENHRPCIQPLVTVQLSDSVPSVFRRLSAQGILSCPVLDGQLYKGFITLFDMVTFVTNMNWGSTGEQWTYFLDNNAEWKTATVEELMNTPPWRRAAQPLYTHNSTLHALEKLAVTRGHRAAVLSSWLEPTVVNIMTQSMLISEIRQRAHLLPLNLRHKTIDTMTSMFEPVTTIMENDTAMNAFIKLKDRNVSGLAIVDDDGVLTGVISVRDLRGIGIDGPYFSRLFLTVKEFKDTLRTEFPALGPKGHFDVGSTPASGRCVTPSSTFENLLNVMADGCIHRVFVCSESSIRNGRPIPEKIVTQTNVLTQVLNFFATPASAFSMTGRG